MKSIKHKKYRLNAFSTVEGIVGGVLISIIMLLTYSTIGNTIDKMNSITILRGTIAYDKWKNNFRQLSNYESELISFEGGKTAIQIQPHPQTAGLLKLEVEILDQENKNVYSWTELICIP